MSAKLFSVGKSAGLQEATKCNGKLLQVETACLSAT